MKANTIDKLNTFFAKNPIAKGEPSTLAEVEKAERELQLKIDEDYKIFTLTFGGSVVKNQEVYGFHSSELMDDTNIIELTESYREDEQGNEDWLIIATDYSGNSIGIDKEGKVVVYDWDLEELVILGNSFEDFILKTLEE